MPPPGHFHKIVVADPAALAKAAAERLLARIAANQDRVAICLTGGSSPKQLYQLLAIDPYRGRIPWARVHWFIGDERFVPADHPLNNMGMARQIFLDRLAPATNIHPIPTDSADPGKSARRYERELQSFYGANELDPVRPLFDVVLMGVRARRPYRIAVSGRSGPARDPTLGGRRAQGACRAVRSQGDADLARPRLLP